MIEQIKSPRFIVLTLLVVAAASTRALPLLIPHIWNFTAVYSLAIFAGSQVEDKRLSLAMPLAAMALSDLFIGNGFSMVVYAGFIAIVMCGMAIKNHVTITNVALASLAGAILFFLITNFALFYPATMYPHNLQGIVSSYVMGLQFMGLQNSLIAEMIYTPILFGAFYLLEKRYPALIAS